MLRSGYRGVQAAGFWIGVAGAVPLAFGEGFSRGAGLAYLAGALIILLVENTRLKARVQ